MTLPPPPTDESHPDVPGQEMHATRRDSFVALLAHEIRNPLAPIRSGVALLRSGLLQEHERAETLSMMDRQLSHLVRLVDDLLASVSVHDGSALESAESVCLADVLGMAIADVGPAIQAKRQVLDVEGADSDVRVLADPRRLAQAFANLLNTGSKKSPRSGRMSVRMHVGQGRAEVRFSDSGPVVPKAQLDDLFELFAHSPAAIGDGLGIGLALVRGLIEMNGGTVTAVDDPGESTTSFVVSMPITELPGATPPPANPAAVGDEPEPAHSRRVLVVDDNQDAAQTVGALLELDGHTIRLAHDGPSAVVQARDFCPEVILMDLGLPGFDGLAATRQIRRLPLLARPTIVAVTGWGSAADRQATRAAGCDLHLVKPVDYREIARALEFVSLPTEESP